MDRTTIENGPLRVMSGDLLNVINRVRTGREAARQLYPDSSLLCDNQATSVRAITGKTMVDAVSQCFFQQHFRRVGLAVPEAGPVPAEFFSRLNQKLVGKSLWGPGDIQLEYSCLQALNLRCLPAMVTAGNANCASQGKCNVDQIKRRLRNE